MTPGRREKVHVSWSDASSWLTASQSFYPCPSGVTVNSGSYMLSTVQIASVSKTGLGSSDEGSAVRAKIRLPPDVGEPAGALEPGPPLLLQAARIAPSPPRLAPAIAALWRNRLRDCGPKMSAA